MSSGSCSRRPGIDCKTFAAQGLIATCSENHKPLRGHGISPCTKLDSAVGPNLAKLALFDFLPCTVKLHRMFLLQMQLTPLPKAVKIPSPGQPTTTAQLRLVGPNPMLPLPSVISSSHFGGAEKLTCRSGGTSTDLSYQRHKPYIGADCLNFFFESTWTGTRGWVGVASITG